MRKTRKKSTRRKTLQKRKRSTRNKKKNGGNGSARSASIFENKKNKENKKEIATPTQNSFLLSGKKSEGIFQSAPKQKQDNSNEYEVFPYNNYTKNLIGKYLPGLYVLTNNGAYRRANNEEISIEKTILLKNKKDFYIKNNWVMILS
jgi:hypothetical protein